MILKLIEGILCRHAYWSLTNEYQFKIATLGSAIQIHRTAHRAPVQILTYNPNGTETVHSQLVSSITYRDSTKIIYTSPGPLRWRWYRLYDISS